jgi:hypothetical protein
MAAHLAGVVTARPYQVPEQFAANSQRFVPDGRSTAGFEKVTPGGC